MVGVLFSRGPEAILAKGTSVEMTLDRQLQYEDYELDFSNSAPRRTSSDGSGPLPSRKTQNGGYPRRFPE
jgi:type IV secretion system protein VirB10